MKIYSNDIGIEFGIDECTLLITKSGNHQKTEGIVLYFDLQPSPKNAIPRWYTGRKWHIPMASNRKRSRGRIKAYDMGQGEGLIVPLQSCTGRE